MAERIREYDIVIAGGGMVGTSLALALAPLSLKVAVVEAVERSAPTQPSFDERSTALSRSSQRMFTAMGLWSDIEAAATPIRSIHVSERGTFGFAHIDASEQGVEALGYVVINRVLGGVLQADLARHSRIDVLCPGRIVAAEVDSGHVTARVASDTGTLALRSRLLVAADGARSNVRDMLGIGATHEDYHQHAIIGNLRSELPHDHRAFERFTERGAIAMLPMTEARSAFVWVVEAARYEPLMQADDAEFLRELQEAFGTRLGALSKVGRRAGYPLTLSKTNGLTVPRGAVVGNAAHGLHPIAAQGFNLGLRDVAALSECVADAADPGAAEVLERYAAWRRTDQQKLVRFTDGLVNLFGDRRAPSRALRTAGMLGFDLVPGVRRLFARHTMGLAGKLPKLSRGVPLQ